MEKNEFTLEIKNNNRIIFFNLFILILFFLIMCSFLLHLMVKRTAYTNQDVQETRGVVTEIIDNDSTIDFIIGQNLYRLGFDLSDNIDRNLLFKCVDNEITLFYVIDIKYDFIVGIDSPYISLVVEEGLESLSSVTGVITVSIIEFLLIPLCIYIFIKFLKSPKLIKVNKAELLMFCQMKCLPFQKKVNKFAIIFAIYILLLIIPVAYFGSVDDTSVVFYIFLSLLCLPIVAFCCASPFLLKKIRKENIKETLTEFTDTLTSYSMDNSFLIYSNYIGATCRFEYKQLVVAFDNDFETQTELNEKLRQREYYFNYQELCFTAKALFRGNGTVNIVIETPLIINNKQLENALILDVDNKLLEIIKRFDLNILGLNFLISNLEKLLNEYIGKMYVVSFDSTGKMITKKLKLKDQLKLQGRIFFSNTKQKNISN